MRTLIAVVLVALVAGVVALGAWIRLAPSNPARWHVDPVAAPDPGQGGTRRTVALEAAPEAALAAFARVAEAAPRTTRLAGSVADGRITWIARSRVWGFPDYVTAAARPADGGAELTVLSRLRFGQGDMGVNARRLDEWLAEMEAHLPPA